MGFQKGETINWDPHHIILGKERKLGFLFEHQENPEMEKETNLERWEEVEQVLIGFEQFKKIELTTFSLIIEMPLRKED